MAGETMPSQLKDMTFGYSPAAVQPETPETPPFDLDDIRTHGWKAKLAEWLLDDPQWLMVLLRRFFPIARVPLAGVTAITRYDDVQEVLSQHRVFDVPWKQYVKDLNEGRTFLLGMDVNKEYHRTQCGVMSVFQYEDVAGIVTPLAHRFSEHIVESSHGELEAIEDLISRVPTLICEEYFGIPVADANPDQDRRDFAHWMIAMSTFTFGNPGNDRRYRRAAMAAGKNVRAIIERAILQAKASPGNNVLGRLIGIQQAKPQAIDDITIRTWLIGMITGFIPTNTLAAGRVLEVLMRRPDFLAKCQAAALAGNDDLLQRCIRETMRFMPIFLGAQRTCVEDYVLAEGTPRAMTIRKGEHVLASTWSAMFDDTRIADPYAFNTNRPASDYMLFGFGVHACLGVLIAEAQILQTMKALLRRKNLRRAPGNKGRMKWLGQFPGKLTVKFDA
jgi:cytochrome P450